VRERASLGTILSAAHRRAFKFSLRPEFENLLQLLLALINQLPFRVVFIIVRLFNTLDICVLCILCICMVQ